MSEEFFEAPAVQAERAVFTSNRSEKVGELMTALAKAQGEYDKAVKDSSNPFYNSKYADLASVTNAVRASFSKHGIAIVQQVSADLERQTAGATTFLYFGEQWVSTTCELPAVGTVKVKDATGKVVGEKDRFDAQTIGAAQTYARRYTLSPLASVAPEDDDANMIVRDDARKTANAPQGTTARQDAQQISDSKFSRSSFLTKAKEYGWGMGEIKAYCVRTYNVKASGDMTDTQMEAALLIFSQKKPADLLTPQAENQDAEPAKE
jgi:hypothetical protein